MNRRFRRTRSRITQNNKRKLLDLYNLSPKPTNKELQNVNSYRKLMKRLQEKYDKLSRKHKKIEAKYNKSKRNLNNIQQQMNSILNRRMVNLRKRYNNTKKRTNPVNNKVNNNYTFLPTNNSRVVSLPYNEKFYSSVKNNRESNKYKGFYSSVK